jgi:hypothetical protein
LIQAIPCIFWPKDLLEEIETLVTLENGSVRHFVLGRLWWAARLRRQDDSEFAKRAVDHFRQVDESYRFGTYHEELAEALVVVHPEQLEAYAESLLASVPGYSLANARRTLLEGAARTENWDAYDRHRAPYREMQEYRQTQGHTDCEVLNLDGLVAIARGRSDQIPDIFRELLARGHNVDFLGTADTLRLVTALLPRKEHLAHCRDYLRMILTREPSDRVAKVLADVEAAMQPRRKKSKPKKKGSRARPSSRSRRS